MNARLVKAAPLILTLSLISVLSVVAQNAPGTPLPPASTTTTPSTPPPAEPNADSAKRAGRPGMGGKFELELKERIETLVKLSPQQLDVELQKWPRYQQMDLGERAKLLQRIQELKERRHKQAEAKARDLGLRLTPEQFATFEDAFWTKRLQADRQLWQEMEPRRKQLDQQINNELKSQFAAFVTPPAPASAPAAPAPAPAKTPAMAPATSSSAGTTP